MSDQNWHEKRNEINGLRLENLPTDVLLRIFKFCDLKFIGRICQVCKRFYCIINEGFVWTHISKSILVTNQTSGNIKIRSIIILSGKEKCRIYYNWKDGKYEEHIYLRQKVKYMPKLVLESRLLWISRGNCIQAFRRGSEQCLNKAPEVVLEGRREDVCHFVKDDNIIISGESNGALVGWSEITRKKIFVKQNCHTSDIDAIDYMENVIVTGSRDESVKLWTMADLRCCRSTFEIGDRVCCVALSSNVFCCGSAGLKNIPPLHIFDTESGDEIVKLLERFRNGAGVLDIHWETPQVLLSCGYDTAIRLWDLRIGKCMYVWEDPHDSAVYSLASDNNNTFLSGLSQHGRIQLWDKRKKNSVQTYFAKVKRSSPVYSVAFDPVHLFAALDQSLSVLDFSGRGNISKNLIAVPRTII